MIIMFSADKLLDKLIFCLFFLKKISSLSTSYNVCVSGQKLRSGQVVAAARQESAQQ